MNIHIQYCQSLILLSFSEQFSVENHSKLSPSSISSSRHPAINLIRQDSYISAVRSSYPNEQTDFGKILK